MVYQPGQLPTKKHKKPPQARPNPVLQAKRNSLYTIKMQFSKTFLSSLFVAAAVATPTPVNTYANEVSAPFENFDPLTAELLTSVVEMGPGVESRGLETRDWVNNVCDDFCVISVEISKHRPKEGPY